MTKSPRKAVIKKPEPQEIYVNIGVYVTFQQTFLKKLKYFNNLNVKDLTDSKGFWKTVKPFSTEKVKTSNNIILSENNKSVKEDGNM